MSVALTFDDGPDPAWTPAVLRALADADAQATFFVMGAAAERWPEEVEATLAAGHDVQLHCHEHVRHTGLSRTGLADDTDRALDVLAELGVEPAWWRAPWGVHAAFTGGVAAERGLSLVRWSADTEDWAGEPAERLLERVAGGLAPGANVLMHDGLGPGARRWGCADTVALVPLLVEAIRTAGLEPGPLPAPASLARERSC